MRLPQDASTPQLIAQQLGDDFCIYDESTGRNVARCIETRGAADLLAAAYLMREALRAVVDDYEADDDDKDRQRRYIDYARYALSAANGTR